MTPQDSKHISTSVHPLTETDIHIAAEILHNSKLSLTINRLLWNDWPNLAAQIASCTSVLENSIKDPETECLKIIENESEALLGFLILRTRKGNIARPSTGAQAENPVTPVSDINSAEDRNPKDESSDNPPAQFNAAILSMVSSAVSQITSQITGQDHIEMTYIATVPVHRHKSLGTQLLQTAFERSRSSNLPLFATSEPAATAFFARAGFTETGHVDMDLASYAPPHTGFGGFRLTGMRWVAGM